MSHVEKREWIGVLRAELVGLAGSFVCLLIGNFLALRSAHPEGLLSLLAYIALTGGAVICGVTLKEGYGAWKLPAIAGGGYALILLTASLIAGGGENLLMRVAVYSLEGVIVLLVSHFLPIGQKNYGKHSKKAAYRYFDRK